MSNNDQKAAFAVHLLISDVFCTSDIDLSFTLDSCEAMLDGRTNGDAPSSFNDMSGLKLLSCLIANSVFTKPFWFVDDGVGNCEGIEMPGDIALFVFFFMLFLNKAASGSSKQI